LRTAKAEGTFQHGLTEKTWCLLVFIPVLVFDCVALQLREGISGRFSRVNHFGWGLFTLSEEKRVDIKRGD
jgi:hypothetical protein